MVKTVQGGDLPVECHPVTPDRWDDMERLFGPRGACGGCWCMWFRLNKREFDAGKGEGNRRAMRRIVAAGETPGLIAYHRGEPVGWCSVAPREKYVRLCNSRILKPVDDHPVWSVVCFFITRQYRGKGVATALLEAAVRYVKGRGGAMVEGYPVEPRTGRMPDAFMYHGLASSFRRAGFTEVARRSETRPIMRYIIKE
ncbi:MAG TPA: GNAT family N-acetyltransferase [Patescibacteria group bacterium]|nr:GNAT family N-acetyltransferase [Patescibacteria group bacterium]